jgi:hypothetical protein
MTKVGIFHAYDGLPSLCAPPRSMNQHLLRVLYHYRHIKGLELLRHLTIVNVILADTGIAAWVISIVPLYHTCF